MKKKARRTMISDNIFAHCDQSGGPNACWPFLRSKNECGYGQAQLNGRTVGAHRIAFMKTHGPIPDGLFVLHSCDNPPCCNPSHLRLGTQKNNCQDREDRNRGNHPQGEQCGTAKLSTKDIIFIKRCRDIYNTAEMAAMLGVARGTISRVLNGERWSFTSPSAQRVEHPYSETPFS